MDYRDYISRQAVLDLMIHIWGENFSGDSAMQESIDAIRVLPSVTPQETKTGHWITYARTYYEELKKRGLGVDEYTPYFTDDIACSECLAKYSTLDNETQFFKYCPNCGAKME